jgi:hypothetical protein
MPEDRLHSRPHLDAPRSEVVDAEPGTDRAVIDAQVEAYQRDGIAAVVPSAAAKANVRRAVRRTDVFARAAYSGDRLVIGHSDPFVTSTRLRDATASGE